MGAQIIKKKLGATKSLLSVGLNLIFISAGKKAFFFLKNNLSINDIIWR